MTSNTVNDGSASNNLPSAKIYQFPIHNKQVRQDRETIMASLLDMKLITTEESLAFIIPPLLDAMFAAGYQLHNEFHIKFLTGLLRAMFYDHFCLDDPILEF